MNEERRRIPAILRVATHSGRSAEKELLGDSVFTLNGRRAASTEKAASDPRALRLPDFVFSDPIEVVLSVFFGVAGQKARRATIC
jgi:hypothetical protein